MKTLWKKWGLALLLACMTFAMPSNAALYAAEDEEYEEDYYDDDYDEDEDWWDDEEEGSTDVPNYCIELKDGPANWDEEGIFMLPGEKIVLTAELKYYYGDEDYNTHDVEDMAYYFEWECDSLKGETSGTQSQTWTCTDTKESSKPYTLTITAYDSDDEVIMTDVKIKMNITDCKPVLSIRKIGEDTDTDKNTITVCSQYSLAIGSAYYWGWDNNETHNLYEVEVKQPDGGKFVIDSGIAGSAGSAEPRPAFTPTMEGTYTLKGLVYRNDKLFRTTKELKLKAVGPEVVSGSLVYRMHSVDYDKKTGTVTLVKSKKSAKSLKSLVIPATVKAKVQFWEEEDIQDIPVQCKVTEIQAKAFKGYKKLKTLTIGKNVTKIGKSAFQGCKVLKKAVIGKSVKEIGVSAFQDCKKLADITIKGKKLKKVGKNAIKKINKKAKIKVPKSKKKAYKKLFKSKTGFKKTMKIK